jgi:hypothetical protein
MDTDKNGTKLAAKRTSKWVRFCGFEVRRKRKEPGSAGHGPNFRLTRKVAGKTVTETFASPAALRKAQREVAEFSAGHA